MIKAQVLEKKPPESSKKAPADGESWGFEVGASIGAGRSVVNRIGGGTRYEVFLAWDENLHALVVAKVLRPHVAQEERGLHELAREADVLARLAHPVLLRGFGACFDGPHPHLAVEHLEGPTLSRLIRRGGPLPLEQVLPVTLHVAAALHYLQRQEVVHLDVKPPNIVVGLPPRLIDLSIARSTERVARLSTAIGTDAYMAPEQCDPVGQPALLGPPADMWGLGATMYHAIAGEVPFPRERSARKSDDPLARFPQLEIEAPPLPGHIPAPLAELVLRMMSRDPEDRPIPEEVAEQLEPLVVLPRKRRRQVPLP